MNWISSKYGLIVCQTEKRLKPEHFLCRTGEEYLPNQMGWAKMNLVLLVLSAVHAHLEIKWKGSHPL